MPSNSLSLFQLPEWPTDFLPAPASLPTYSINACSLDGSWIVHIVLLVAKEKRLLVFFSLPCLFSFSPCNTVALVFLNCFLWSSELFLSPVACPMLLEHGEPLQTASAGRDCAASRLLRWEAGTLFFQKVHLVIVAVCSVESSFRSLGECKSNIQASFKIWFGVHQL